jgi:hypothetical protein
MSWAINTTGTPAKVVDAIAKYSSTLSGQSKEEFDKAAPHIAAVVDLNHGGYSADEQIIIRLNAYGHAQGDQICRVSVNVELIAANI